MYCGVVVDVIRIFIIICLILGIDPFLGVKNLLYFLPDFIPKLTVCHRQTSILSSVFLLSFYQLPPQVLAHLHHVLSVQCHRVHLFGRFALVKLFEDDFSSISWTQLLDTLPVMKHLTEIEILYLWNWLNLFSDLISPDWKYLMSVVHQLGHCRPSLGSRLQVILEDQSQLVPHPLLSHPGRENELSLEQLIQELQHGSLETSLFCLYLTSCTACVGSQGSTSMGPLQDWRIRAGTEGLHDLPIDS